MSAFSLTYDDFLKLRLREDRKAVIIGLLGNASKWARPVTMGQARAAGCTFDDILRIACAVTESNPDIKRCVLLFLADCAARVLHIAEKHGKADAPRKAIIAVRAYARGEITADALETARAASWGGLTAASNCAVWAATLAVVWEPIRTHPGYAASDATTNAARAVACGVAWDAACEAERAWQFDRLIARLSDNEPEDWPLLAKEDRGAAIRETLRFSIGDRVEKYTGDYIVQGEVRAVFTLRNGATRYCVEIDAREGGSFVHIYSDKNLRLRGIPGG